MPRGLQEKTRKLIDAAHTFLVREHPATLRHVFYGLIAIVVLENDLKAYKRLMRALVKGREEGLVPWEWMVDRSRTVVGETGFASLVEYADAVAGSYKRRMWDLQPRHVEIITEKDAIVGAIQPVLDEFGVTLRVLRGHNSASRMHEVAEMLDEAAEGGKPVEFLYVGDFDPSGKDIERDFAVRAKRYMETQVRRPFRSRRLAILPGDIRRFKLPPQRVKDTDSRTPKFLARHGSDCVELDALPPTELRRRLREAILGLVDAEIWERTERVEKAEQESVRKFAARLAALSPTASRAEQERH